MIGLWIAAALLCALAIGLLIRRAASAAASGDLDDQGEDARRALTEIEALADRGLLNAADKASARGEVGRRLLRERRAAAEATGPAHPRTDRAILLAAGGLAPLLVLGGYLAVGRPGLPDQAFAGRLAAWRKADPAELRPAQMEAVLADAARANPRDVRPLNFLAQLQSAQGRSLEAARSLRRAAEIEPGNAALWTALGQAEVAANADHIGPAARLAFANALRLQPGEPNARYFLAKALIEGGDRAAGLAAWRELEADLPADDPRRTDLAAEIAAAGGAPAPGAQ